MYDVAPVNAILVVLPLQKVDAAGVAVPVGVGFTVTSTVKEEPTHPPGAVGVTVYLTTPAVGFTFVNVCAILVPHDDEQLLNPVTVAPLNCTAVHVNVVLPIDELRVTDDAVPVQMLCGDAEPTGKAVQLPFP